MKDTLRSILTVLLFILCLPVATLGCIAKLLHISFILGWYWTDKFVAWATFNA